MSEPDPAAARWLVLQIVRIVGVATVLIGLLHTAGRFAPFTGLPPEIGYVFIGVGMVEAFVLPILLARRWKSPPP